MPRSFLVKKVKLDEFAAGPELESAYRHRTDLSLRLHDKGRSGARRARVCLCVCTRLYHLWKGPLTGVCVFVSRG